MIRILREILTQIVRGVSIWIMSGKSIQIMSEILNWILGS